MQKVSIYSLLILTISLSSIGIDALLCLECDTLTHPGCGYAQDIQLTVPLVDCGEVGQCYVAVLDEVTKRVARGCRNDDHCNAFGCALCGWDSCNDFQEIYDHCVSCSSASDSDNNDCKTNVAANYRTEVCEDTIVERSGCYLQIKDNVYTRDCVTNLNEETLEECLKGENCKICKEDGCNSKGNRLNSV